MPKAFPPCERGIRALLVDVAGAVDGDSVSARPGNVHQQGTNSAFGGPDGRTMLIVGGGTNARTVQMTVPGLP